MVVGGYAAYRHPVGGQKPLPSHLPSGSGGALGVQLAFASPFGGGGCWRLVGGCLSGTRRPTAGVRAGSVKLNQIKPKLFKYAPGDHTEQHNYVSELGITRKGA